MASTVFTDFVTPVPAAWLNDSNTATYVTVPAHGVSISALQAALAALITVPPGTLIDFAGTAAPTGYLACPLIANSSGNRTTHAALFAAIGTTWGAGDGTTTFGLPWFPVDYTSVQSNANVGTSSVGQVIAHTHNYNTYGGAGNVGLYQPASAGMTTQTPTSAPTASGPSNLAAGVRVLKCVKL